MILRKLAGIAGAVCCAVAAGAAAAPDGDDLARAFGAREAIQQISLSPDGTKVAVVAPIRGRGSSVFVAEVLSGKAPVTILRASGEPERLKSCHWVSNDRIICTFYAVEFRTSIPVALTRQIAVDADGKNLKEVTAPATGRELGLVLNGGQVIDWTGDNEGSVMMTRVFVPEIEIGTKLASSSQGLGVQRVDTRTLVRRTIEAPKPNATSYISDGHGNVRLMAARQPTSSGYLSGQYSWLYRKPGTKDWSPLGSFTDNGVTPVGFDPQAVDPVTNLAYGFDTIGGRRALVSVALDGSLARQTVLAQPEVDIDDLIQLGRQRRVVGVSWATEMRTADYFDPALKSLRAALGRALPGAPIVNFVDASADESKLLIYAGSDTDPGRYYLLDRTTKQMTEVLPVRPQLGHVKLGPTKPIRFPAADGTMIPGYLTLPADSNGKGLPAIVMPHGGPGSRDEWGFDWLVQFFVARGFAVLQPNFRGSAGYGAQWFQKNGFQSWRTAIGDVDDAGRWLIKEGIARPGKLAIFGWSYGGYAALQSQILDPSLYKTVIAVAPVTDLSMLKDESANYTNHFLETAFIGDGAHISEGSPARHADAFRAPVLMFHGTDDMNVGISESRYMAERLRAAGKTVELVEYKGLDHQLEDDAARAEMLAKSDAFLRAALGL